jgi:hypothetical protein
MRPRFRPCGVGPGADPSHASDAGQWCPGLGERVVEPLPLVPVVLGSTRLINMASTTEVWDYSAAATYTGGT